MSEHLMRSKVEEGMTDCQNSLPKRLTRKKGGVSRILPQVQFVLATGQILETPKAWVASGEVSGVL